MSQSTKTLHSFGSLEVDGQGVSNKGHVTELTEATTLTAAQSNTTFFLNSATEFAVTLPAAATAGAGWKCRVVVTGAPSGADYTVVTSDTTNIHGHVLTNVDAGGSSGATAGTGVGTITFADGKALKGDYAEVVCDGTDWFATCVSAAFDGITLS